MAAGRERSGDGEAPGGIPPPGTAPHAPRARAFWLPKEGHGEAEYEDAFRLTVGEGAPWRVAVADGATETAFARDWARRLAEGFAAGRAEEAFEGRLAAWQSGWEAEVAGRVRGLPWYAAEKAEEGAYAALLGLTLAADGRWEALAVGDCCLFHLRGGACLLAWPLSTPEAFTSRPALLPSRPGRPVPAPARQAGTAAPGDAFLLATDALAAWLLRTGPAAAAALTEATFAEAVSRARRARTLRNDDVTLVVVEV